MTYVKNDDTWTYEEDPDFPLDESAVNTKMNCLTTLTVDRVLESPEDLSEYGLDKPQQEVTVLKTDGTTFTLYIGNQNSSNNDFYVKVDRRRQSGTLKGGLRGPASEPEQQSPGAGAKP